MPEEKNKTVNTGVKISFLIVCGLLCLLPLIGMLWTTGGEVKEELAAFPAIQEDGVVNVDFLSELGDYFEDHFAYRNQVVSANSVLRAKLFGVSSTDTVVVGADDWLYYAGTLSDYGSWVVLSQRSIDNIGYNLFLMQAYTVNAGTDFILTIAPNKNTLYGGNMPYYYVAGEEHNLEALEEVLEKYGIYYADMYALFSAQDEVLYYRKDTHWNTKGALLACQALLTQLGNDTATESLSGIEATVVDDYIGDLNTMLYPSAEKPEEDYSYDADLEWYFTEGESVEDSQVTTAGSGTGTLLMYRDSFANNMIPFLADVYETAYFTKMVPYDLNEASQVGADAVIIERAERNIADLGEDPAIMPAPGISQDVDVQNLWEGETLESGGVLYADAASSAASSSEAFSSAVDAAAEGTAVLYLTQDGDYTVVTGDLPEALRSEEVQMYVGLEDAEGTISWYVPFHLTTDVSDYGYEAYFYPETYAQAVTVYLACSDADGNLICVGGIDAQQADENE